MDDVTSLVITTDMRDIARACLDDYSNWPMLRDACEEGGWYGIAQMHFTNLNCGMVAQAPMTSPCDLVYAINHDLMNKLSLWEAHDRRELAKKQTVEIEKE